MLAAALCGWSGARGQTFSNTTTAACDAWNSGNAYTGFQRTIAVSGMPSPLGPTEAVLRQVNLRLDNASCKGNLSSYYARTISPAGTVIQLFGPFATTSTSQWMDIKLRDDPALERVRDYSIDTQQNCHPWSIGYHRTEVADVFATVNGVDPNGNWTLRIAENTASKVSFERVDLVFGPPIRVKDVTGTGANSDCTGSTCIDAVEVVRAPTTAIPSCPPSNRATPWAAAPGTRPTTTTAGNASRPRAPPPSST